jgi:hypothetical protein
LKELPGSRLMLASSFSHRGRVVLRVKRPKNALEDAYDPPNDVLAEIGRIALTCGSVEDILHSIYWRYLDTAYEIAQLITADEKPSRLAEDILKMAAAIDEEPERIDDMRALFGDFKELSEIRNKCLHWIWHRPRQSKRGQKHWLHPPSYKRNRKAVPFTVKQLKKVNLDLGWIELRMRTHAMSEEEFEQARDDCDPQIVHLIVPAPWLDRQRKSKRVRWERIMSAGARRRRRQRA